VPTITWCVHAVVSDVTVAVSLLTVTAASSLSVSGCSRLRVAELRRDSARGHPLCTSQLLSFVRSCTASD
jgi:hypothetical protein